MLLLSLPKWAKVSLVTADGLGMVAPVVDPTGDGEELAAVIWVVGVGVTGFEVKVAPEINAVADKVE